MFNTKSKKTIILVITIIINIIFFQLFGQEIKNDNDHFYFVQIADTHIGKGTNLEITQNMVKQINYLPMEIKFVIHTGDILQDGMSDTTNVKKAISALEKLEIPLYYIPGNHDIFQERVEKEINIFQKYFGDLVFTKEFEEISFIGIYSDPLAYSFTVEGYDPFLELEKALKKTDGKPVVVGVMHARAFKEAKNLRDQLLEQLDCTQIGIYDISPVIGAHVGPRTVGLAIYTMDGK